jgi:hypothetical protein
VISFFESVAKGSLAVPLSKAGWFFRTFSILTHSLLIWSINLQLYNSYIDWYLHIFTLWTPHSVHFCAQCRFAGSLCFVLLVRFLKVLVNRFLALSRASWCLQMLNIEWFLSGEHRIPSRHLVFKRLGQPASHCYLAQWCQWHTVRNAQLWDFSSYAQRFFAWIISRNMPCNCLKTTNSLSDSASQYVHCMPSMSFYYTSWFFIFVLVLLPKFEHPRWR